jgi:hypothetical protein
LATVGFDFEVALSFAGEDREYVRDVRDRLVEHGRRVFYDEDHLAEMWGADLPEYFDEVYRVKARYVVVFVSRHYVDKAWPRQEKRSALARALDEKGPYVLPVHLDDTSVPGLPKSLGYIDARRTGLDALVELILAKLDGKPVAVDAAVWDGATPRRHEHLEQVLRERPPGWEHLLLAGALFQGMRALDGKYRDHELRFARQSGKYVSDADAFEYMSQSLDRSTAIVEAINRLFEASAQERALGPPGSPGDPDRIIHLADRILTVYEDLMDWAADLRGVTVAPMFRTLYELTACLVDQPIEEFRRWVSELVGILDKLPTHLAEPEPREPLNASVALKLTVPDETRDKVIAESRRLRRLMGPPPS